MAHMGSVPNAWPSRVAGAWAHRRSAWKPDAWALKHFAKGPCRYMVCIYIYIYIIYIYMYYSIRYTGYIELCFYVSVVVYGR